MRRTRRCLVAAGLCLSAAACGGEATDVSADATPDAAFACEAPDGDAGEPFDLTLGVRLDGTDFVELADGDPAPVVLGIQGFYMLQLESRASLSVSSPSICFDCVLDVGPSGEFAGISAHALIGFEEMPSGLFRGAITVILGSHTDRAKLDGAEVSVSQTCNGHGLSGSGLRNVVLTPE